MNKYISFSGGVESSTMCVLFGRNADAIFADAGWEHRQVYDRIDLVQERVREIHGNDFTIHRIKADITHKGERVDNLVDYIKTSKYFPSPISRYCTRMFKIKPIDEFLNNKGEVELLIGLNFDEQHRTGNHGNMKNVKYSYPLIENKISRDGCKLILERAGLLPNFPPYMQRGGCVGCFYKSKKEFYAMAQLAPEEFKQVEDMENEIQDERGKFYKLRTDLMSMRDLREYAESAMFKPEEMYSAEITETPCGVFCNR